MSKKFWILVFSIFRILLQRRISQMLITMSCGLTKISTIFPSTQWPPRRLLS